MVHFQKDYLVGTAKQRTILPYLEQHFGDIIPTEERWAKFDFYNQNAIFELKSRTNKKNHYPTTLMTCNKVIDTEKDIYFVFYFTDELCYIKYDPELFSKFEKKPYSRINEQFDEKDYYFIPISNLETIKKF
jgi:hypothetical protein